jgi:hypothetical protein
MAIGMLVAEYQVSPTLITVVSQGDWTLVPVPCPLDIPERIAAMLDTSERRQIILSVKGKPYEFWAFNMQNDRPLVFACRRSL